MEFDTILFKELALALVPKEQHAYGFFSCFLTGAQDHALKAADANSQKHLAGCRIHVGYWFLKVSFTQPAQLANPFCRTSWPRWMITDYRDRIAGKPSDRKFLRYIFFEFLIVRPKSDEVWVKDRKRTLNDLSLDIFHAEAVSLMSS